MNVAPVVIEDDDIIMVNNDNDKNNGLKNNASSNVDIIDLDEEPTAIAEGDSSFANLLKNNMLMNKVVHQCLNMENNTGMSRVISKTLLPLYADTDNQFKESEQFTELLKKYLKRLKYDPNYKFLHVKSLCEDLKSGQYRKKVPFVTLSRGLSSKKEKEPRQRLSEKNKRLKSQQCHDTKKTKRNPKETDVINLDNSDDEPVINLDGDEDINLISNGDDDNNDDIMIVEDTAHSDNKSHCDLLVPKKSVEPDQHSNEFKRVEAIEQQIALYQEKIVQLEEEEVPYNCLSSPYVLCDKYKKKIVQLYKKLCKITGKGDGSLLKQRVVRLQVVEGHPAGPVKRLERFLNSTIDETGVVPLPDLHDVVRCVSQSNIVDRLGWSKQEIMKEAIALFTQCGQALRKSRQRREYKDLLSLVRDKNLDDYDPANEDPHLLAKLEANKVIAKANEEEILDRFVKMESMPKTSQALTPRLSNISRIRIAGYTDTESDSESDVSSPQKRHQTENFNKAEMTTERKDDEIPHINNKPKLTNSNLDKNKTKHKINIIATEIPHSSIKESEENVVNINSIQHTIDTILNKALTTQSKINTINTTTQDTTNITKLNVENYINSTTPRTINNDTQNKVNYTTQNLTYTITQNTINTTEQNAYNQQINISTPQIIQNPVNNLYNTQTHHLCSNTLSKIGNSNSYVASYYSHNIPLQHVYNNVSLDENNDSNPSKSDTNTENTDNMVKIKDVPIKQEAIDINSQLGALGDNYILTIFDIEDPFLVVDISSDSSSDDDL